MIWIVSKYASLPKYGPASRLFFLAKYFNKQKKTILITSDSNHIAKYPPTNKRHNKEIIENVEVHWIKTFKYKKTFSIKRIISWIDFEIGLFTLNKKIQKKPEIIIISSLSLFSIIFGYYMKIKYKSFLVFEIRDIWPLTLISESKYSKLHPAVIFLSMIEKFGYRNSDLITGTMPKLNVHVKKTIGYEKDFLCSPIGYDPSQFDNIDSLSEKILSKFPENKIVVGYAGSLSVSNSIGILIKVIKSLSHNSNIHFMLVGSGDYKKQLEEECKYLRNVSILDKIPFREVNSFLKKCDILYLSTSKTEIWEYGQSMNKLLEYMIAGKPIVASYSGYPSMLNEAQSGLFVDVDKIEEVVSAILYYSKLSSKERHSIGNKGSNWVSENRSYKTLADEYLLKVNKLIESNRDKKTV
tara:strand:+ start:101 stop:1333 length:1233 start_codon:yes stop_codon:yes gene_type:complete